MNTKKKNEALIDINVSSKKIIFDVWQPLRFCQRLNCFIKAEYRF